MRWHFVRFYCCFITVATATSGALCELITVNANEIRDDISQLTQPTILYNYGTITSDIATDGNTFDIYNYGTISGTISGGFVKQYINSGNAFNTVHVGTGDDLYVYINGVNNIDLATLISLGDATEFNIEHSSIMIDDLATWNNWNQSVVLDRTNELIFTNPGVVQPGDVVNHISENLSVSVRGLDSASVPELSSNYGSWVINFVPNPNYPLSNVLNSVSNSEDKNRIKQLSYHFNPSVLMKPVKIINEFVTSNMLSYKNSLYSGLSGSYIMSDKTDAYGFDLNVKGKYNDIYLSAGFHFYDFSYQDDYNDFDGLMYGFNIGAKTYFDNLWLDGIVGLSVVDFDADNILYNNETRNNPFGFGGYGTINLGYDYVVMPDLIVSPFVGISGATYHVYDINDTDYGLRGGGKVEYSFVTDNIRYEYSGAGAVSINGDLYGVLKIGFVSEIDNAGLVLGFDVLKTDEGTGYKISVSGNISF